LTGFKIARHTVNSVLASTGDLVVVLLLMENLTILFLPTLLSTGGLETGVLIIIMVLSMFLNASGLQVDTLFNSLALKAAAMAMEPFMRRAATVTGKLLTNPSTSTALSPLAQLLLLLLLLDRLLAQVLLLLLLLAQVLLLLLLLALLQALHLALLLALLLLLSHHSISLGKVGQALSRCLQPFLQTAFMLKFTHPPRATAEEISAHWKPLETKPFAVDQQPTLVK
jgi:hypothetical protein